MYRSVRENRYSSINPESLRVTIYHQKIVKNNEPCPLMIRTTRPGQTPVPLLCIEYAVQRLLSTKSIISPYRVQKYAPKVLCEDDIGDSAQSSRARAFAGSPSRSSFRQEVIQNLIARSKDLSLPTLRASNILPQAPEAHWMCLAMNIWDSARG